MMKKALTIFRVAIIIFAAALAVQAQTTTSASNKGASPQQMVRMVKDYYAAYEKKDWSLMEPILAAGFTFTSPAGDDHINLDLYKKRCWPNAYKTKKI